MTGQAPFDMTTIIIHEAKTHLSRIVEEVAAGAEVDFNAPLPDATLADFEGR
jgi:hypothetical protein